MLFLDQADGKIATRMVFAARYNNSQQESKKISQHLINSSMGHLRDNTSRITQNDFASGILTSNLKKSIKLLPDMPEKSLKSHTRQNSPAGHKASFEVSDLLMRRNISKTKQYERLKRSNIEHIFQLFK